MGSSMEISPPIQFRIEWAGSQGRVTASWSSAHLNIRALVADLVSPNNFWCSVWLYKHKIPPPHLTPLSSSSPFSSLTPESPLPSPPLRPCTRVNKSLIVLPASPALCLPFVGPAGALGWSHLLRVLDQCDPTTC